MTSDTLSVVRKPPGESLWAVFGVFLRLGLTSFGGPVAHLGYFRETFVRRRRWLDEAAFAEIVALCQFLPGPASSQVGFALGLLRAGLGGALAAWLGFTLPSAIMLILFAHSAHFIGGAAGMALLHGLKLTAVAVVAHAVIGMARTLCTDRPRQLIAILSLVLMAFIGFGAQVWWAIGAGGLAGYWARLTGAAQNQRPLTMPISKPMGVGSLVLFVFLLIGLPILGAHSSSRDLAIGNAFYHCGALVFGGGHVVLPLLREAFVGSQWVTDNAFLAGYGAAQAVPGPLFTFAAYLGALTSPAGYGLWGAVLGLVGIFLPGFLLLIGALYFWARLGAQAGVRSLVAGVNAAVVGVLAYALYNPVFLSSVQTISDGVLVLLGLLALQVWRLSAAVVVVFTVLICIARALAAA